VGDGPQIYDRNRVFNVSVSHNILLIINNIILCCGTHCYTAAAVFCTEEEEEEDASSSLYGMILYNNIIYCIHEYYNSIDHSSTDLLCPNPMV